MGLPSSTGAPLNAFSLNLFTVQYPVMLMFLEVEENSLENKLYFLQLIVFYNNLHK